MKTGAKRWFAAAAAVGMAAVVGVGIWAGVHFGTKDKVDFGENMLVTPSGGSDLMQITSTTVETRDGQTTQQLTANVNPSTADVLVDWTIAWSGSAVSWGSGSQGTVTDYVTVTPSSDGARTATVTCKAPFGTKAVVTASIRGRSDIKDTCAVDYVQRYSDVTASLSFSDGTSSRNESWTLGSSTSVTVGFPQSTTVSDLAAYNGSGSATAAYSDVYTIASGANTVTVSYAFTESYVAALAEAGVTKTAGSYQTLNSSLSGNKATLSAFSADDILGLNGQSVTTVEYSAYKSYLASHANDVMLNIKIDVASKENVSGGSKVYQVKFADIGQTQFTIDIPETSIRF